VRNDRWQKIEQIYHAAAGIDPEEREKFVRQASDGDDSLHQEVLSLLAASAPTDQFLNVPALHVAAKALAFSAAATSQAPPAPALPESIGRFRVLRSLGEGGMGLVLLAEQTSPIRRQVALKLIRAGLYDGSVLQRFQSEQQSLAVMNHPSIAKVFDAGTTPDGQPYFVMEYVDGPSITKYCDNKKLKIGERLQLFIQVCEGVQHAHQKAIIHRDLKPSNVLIAEVDGKPVPRIIDFGIAKAISSHTATEQTLFTQAGALVGTPSYMSPEQAAGPRDVDTRTDVYSLGVIFYLLLTGSLPFDTAQWKKRPIDEVLRQLREDDPPSPSTKLDQDKGTSASSAEQRGVAPAELTRLLRGDLDWITLKALEKDRARRYGSPMELAADIRRYLGNEPVTARPASVGYRAKKYVLRHKTLMAGTTAVLLVLVAGVITSTWEAVQARRAEARAKQQSAIAQAVNDFLQNDLLAQASAAKQSGPSAKPDPDLKVRTALDRAAGRIGGKFANQPEVEASIRDTIGQTYMDLGLYPDAQRQLERALDLSRHALGAMDPKAIKTMSRLGRIADLQGRYPEAEALFREALESQRRVLGPEHPDTLISMQGLASVYYSQGKYALAEALHSQTLEIRRRVLGPEHPDTLMSNNGLAVDYQMQGKYAQAEALHSQTLEIRRRVLGPEHPDTLNSMNNLAIVYYLEGKYAEAVALYSETLEIRRRVLGPDHPYTLTSMHNLATAYYYQGNYAQAEELHRETLEIKRRVLGPEHPDTLTTMNNLAAVYAVQRKYPEAEALFTRTVEISRRVLGPEHPLTLSYLAEFAFLYQREGKYASAETYAAQSLAGRRHALGVNNAVTMSSAQDLALAYQSQGKFAEAEPLAREALEFNRKQQPDDWQRFRAESLLGASLTGQKKYTEAEPLLLEGYRGMSARSKRMGATDLYHLDCAREWIVQLYKAWGKPQKAAQMAQEPEK
jgi:eukaryotic-like serine/threonine-protein kinase